MRKGSAREIQVVRDNPVGEDIRECFTEAVEVSLHSPNAVGLLRQQSDSILAPSVVIEQVAHEQLGRRIVDCRGLVRRPEGELRVRRGKERAEPIVPAADLLRRDLG